METPTKQERPFRMCSACGRLTPTHLPRCVECGEPSVQAMAEAVEREHEQRFARAFFTRGTPATWALIGANVAIFVLMALVAHTIDPSDPRYNDALIAFGAKVKPLIDEGQYWRFVTPAFIHIGVMHLGVNMYSLYAIGPQVERLYGTARFLILYLVAGTAGVVGSYLLSSGAGVSAGASGALFGLLGVLLVFGIRYRSELPGMFRQAFNPRGLMPVLLLNLFITFAFPIIDKWAHLGGLIAGAALAAVIPYFRSNERRASVIWRVVAALCVIGTLTCFGFAFKSYKGSANVGRFVDVYNATNKAVDAAVTAAAKAADRQAVLPTATTEARDAATTARSGAGVDKASSDLLERDAALLDRIADALSAGPGALTPEAAQGFDAERRQLEHDWDDWLGRNGASYGVGKDDKDNGSGGDDGN
jgi:rhomboid protease GluP